MTDNPASVSRWIAVERDIRAEVGKSLFCKDCAAYSQGSLGNAYGWCRRFAPRSVYMADTFPVVNDTDFCFDIIPKEDK